MSVLPNLILSMYPELKLDVPGLGLFSKGPLDIRSSSGDVLRSPLEKNVLVFYTDIKQSAVLFISCHSFI